VVCIVDELAILPRLVDEIKVPGYREAELVDGVRELIEHLRFRPRRLRPLVDSSRPSRGPGGCRSVRRFAERVRPVL
jgi:hypothetical protein